MTSQPIVRSCTPSIITDSNAHFGNLRKFTFVPGQTKVYFFYPIYLTRRTRLFAKENCYLFRIGIAQVGIHLSLCVLTLLLGSPRYTFKRSSEGPSDDGYSWRARGRAQLVTGMPSQTQRQITTTPPSPPKDTSQVCPQRHLHYRRTP